MKSKAIILVYLIFGSAIGKATELTKILFAGQEYPPFNWSEGGKTTGGTVEVVKKICANLQLNCVFEIMPLKRALLFLESGEAQAVISLNPNADRESFSVQSVPIISSRLVYMVRQGTAETVKSPSDLKGYSLVTLRASTSYKAAEKLKSELKDLTLLDENNTETMVKKLSQDRYGAKAVVVGNEDVLKYFAKKFEIKNLEVRIASAQTYIIAFSKKNSDSTLVEKFNKQIQSLKSSGELKSILAPFDLHAN